MIIRVVDFGGCLRVKDPSFINWGYETSLPDLLINGEWVLKLHQVKLHLDQPMPFGNGLLWNYNSNPL